MSNVQEALAIAARGIAVFPAREKKPLVRWKDVASTDPDRVNAWWVEFPDAEVGVPLPPNTMAVDVDDLEAFKASTLEKPFTSVQQTRSGGFHLFYRTNGNRPVPQTVKRGGIALDTRVGGLGYVISYDPAAFQPEQWAFAPAWVYEDARIAHAERAPGAPLTTRPDIMSFLGTFAARGIELTAGEYLAVLRAKQIAGGIVDSDPKRPWTDRDLAKLASEAGKFEVGLLLAPPVLAAPGVAVADLEGMDAVDLLKLDIAPLRWAVRDFIPEGFGLLASPPKVGKSLLCYQLAVALTLGTPLLGRTTEQRPVRYYALEDGKRRSQSRIAGVLQQRDMPRGLELRWSAPKLGGPLETECHEWLQQHAQGVIIIDVLSKVRPDGGSRGKNAYDEDYSLLTNLHTAAKMNPGSVILVVTHDRKAGGDDWITRITGTRGIPGVADFSIFIDRKRGKPTANISATGRDQADMTILAEFSGTGWSETTQTIVELREVSSTRRSILDYLSLNPGVGPALIAAHLARLGVDASENIVRSQLNRMKGRDVVNSGDGWRLMPDEMDDADE